MCGSIMVRQIALLVSAALFAFPVVYGQGNNNLFQFGNNDDDNGMGQPHWGQVQCRDIDTCVSTMEDCLKKEPKKRFHYCFSKQHVFS